MNCIVSWVFDKQRGRKKRLQVMGAQSSLKTKRISHIFTIDTLLGPAVGPL